MQSRGYLMAIFALVCTLYGTQAVAWGPNGHHTVGAIADKLLSGTNATKQVRVLLGDIRLQDAAVWADCAKGVDLSRGYAYTSGGVHPECKIFETPEREAEMIDFVGAQRHELRAQANRGGLSQAVPLHRRGDPAH